MANGGAAIGGGVCGGSFEKALGVAAGWRVANGRMLSALRSANKANVAGNISGGWAIMRRGNPA